jgi:hypothetical protein
MTVRVNLLHHKRLRSEASGRFIRTVRQAAARPDSPLQWIHGDRRMTANSIAE